MGGLEAIVDDLYAKFMREGVKASIYVVCGRNEKLKENLAKKDWGKVLAGGHKPKKRSFLARLRRKRKNKLFGDSADKDSSSATGDVNVVGLGFVTQMAEYMVAADVLVSKAGPGMRVSCCISQLILLIFSCAFLFSSGTIAEAACVGLPVMMTSFLPGQEAGNVEVVLEDEFGEFNEDPEEIAAIVSSWLKDPKLLEEMSRRAKKAGRPHAAADIALDIGTQANTWKSLNVGTKRMSDLKL